jgi:hypothetical protein
MINNLLKGCNLFIYPPELYNNCLNLLCVIINNHYVMKSVFLITIVLFLMISSYAQDYSGTYVLNSGSAQIILILKENETGLFTGSLSGNNNVIKVAGPQFRRAEQKCLSRKYRSSYKWP